nr:GDSL-type esterase/lipase family protein [uncultured Blautia sp.]
MGLIVFLGDSITDAGRKESPNQLGYGYVNIFSEQLNKQDQQLNIINKGVDGQFTEQIAQSLHPECIFLHPDYVSILVGINDIGLLVASDVSEQEKLYMLEDSIRAYHEMLFDLSRETTAKIITLEPFIFPKDGAFEEWIPWQKKMSKNIRKLARNYGASFVPLQEPLEQKIEELGYDAITTDGMHLTSTGHEILAALVKESFDL